MGGWADTKVEKMPGPRCIFDGILLPNGHVLLLGGQKVWAPCCNACMHSACAVLLTPPPQLLPCMQVGLGDLTDSPSYNGGHEPYAVPWIYRPNAPAGSRFLVTGARTRIARMYHSTSILTKDGDVLVVSAAAAAGGSKCVHCMRPCIWPQRQHRAATLLHARMHARPAGWHEQRWLLAQQ